MLDIDDTVVAKARSKLGQAKSKVGGRGKAQIVLSDMREDLRQLSNMVQRLIDPYNGNTKRKAKIILGNMLEDMKKLPKWCKD